MTRAIVRNTARPRVEQAAPSSPVRSHVTMPKAIAHASAVTASQTTGEAKDDRRGELASIRLLGRDGRSR